MRAGAKGRHAKSKARLARFDELPSQEPQKRNETKQLYIPPGPGWGTRSSRRATSASVSGRNSSSRTWLLPAQRRYRRRHRPERRRQDHAVPHADGYEQPDAGALRIGETAHLACVDQSRDRLDGRKTVWEEISDGRTSSSSGIRGQLADLCLPLQFHRGRPAENVGDLSGGERNRVHLAKLLKSGGNVLLLDEPTNDLDVETLRALEEALLDFAGCAVVISHDRWFLDRIATHILAFEGDSQVVWFEGNYADYEADRKRRLGTDAEQPHRIKFKRLNA